MKSELRQRWYLTTSIELSYVRREQTNITQIYT